MELLKIHEFTEEDKQIFLNIINPIIYHPEFIKTFHKIGLLCSESKIPDVRIPASKADDPAEILYGKS